MSLQEKVMTSMKEAMRAKDTTALEALRAVKSALLLAQTESGSKEAVTEEQELKLLQKLVKQRKESAVIYKEQGREDLAKPELEQAIIIESFLPEQMSEEEIEAVVTEIIEEQGATGLQDMGKVMGAATNRLAGKADGKTISTVVRKKLS